MFNKGRISEFGFGYNTDIISDKWNRFPGLHYDPWVLGGDAASPVTTLLTTQKGGSIHTKWNVHGLATLSQSGVEVWCWGKLTVIYVLF